MGVLELIDEYKSLLASHIKQYGNKEKVKVSYLSATICEDFIQLIGDAVLEFLINQLKKAKYYSIVDDSTSDVSHVDQLTFVFHYVLEDGTLVERFIGFIPMSGHTEAAMENLIMEKLEEHAIKMNDCRGPFYDNA